MDGMKPRLLLLIFLLAGVVGCILCAQMEKK